MVDYCIWGMTQKRVYQVPIQLRQRLVQTWPEFQHSVVYDATDHWRRRLEACSLSMQMAQHISTGLLANVLYATARPSVVCLSVTLVHPTQAVEIFGNFYGVWYVGHPLTSAKNFTDIVQGEPLRRGS